MLVTSTRAPPSCVARLPQKFSAATTFGFPSEDLPGAGEQAERLTSSSALSPIPTARVVTQDLPFPLTDES